MKIGELAKSSFRRLFNENRLSPIDITNLLKDEYSHSEFGLNWKVLRYTSEGTTDKLGNGRYYTREIFGDKYYLTSQWYERQRGPLLEWLRKIEK